MRALLKVIIPAGAGLIIALGVALVIRVPWARPAESVEISRMVHRVVIQISQDDPKTMNLALNNAENLTNFYRERDQKVEIEFVALGPGIAMVRSDDSPVKDRLARMSHDYKNITFSGCGNTLAKVSKAEGRQITLLPEAHLVPTGIARIVQLEERGWTYVRP